MHFTKSLLPCPADSLLEIEICLFQNETAIFVIYVHSISFLSQRLALTREKNPHISTIAFLSQFLYSYFCIKIVNGVNPQTSVRVESATRCSVWLPEPAAQVPRGRLPRSGPPCIAASGPQDVSVLRPQTAAIHTGPSAA